jgi:aspartokinase
METIAVYWESRIKTYGFQKIPQLALIELSCPIGAIKSLGDILTNDDMQALTAPFIAAQESDRELSFIFCLPEREGKGLHASLEQSDIPTYHRCICPVGIIFFHGPHFGDRYGIAEVAFSAISKAGIQLIASGCASSSVYLILAQDDLDRAEEVLSKTFEVAT